MRCLDHCGNLCRISCLPVGAFCPVAAIYLLGCLYLIRGTDSCFYSCINFSVTYTEPPKDAGCLSCYCATERPPIVQGGLSNVCGANTQDGECVAIYDHRYDVMAGAQGLYTVTVAIPIRSIPICFHTSVTGIG